MKKGMTAALAGLALAGCVSTPPLDERPVEVMSFNILCSFCVQTGFDRWDERLPELDAALERGQADLIGLQEPFSGREIDYFLGAHPDYAAWYYVDPGNPEPPLPDYPDATVLYRADRFTLVDSGVLWLSETPDEPWSFGFADGQFWRVLAWAELEQISDGRHLLFATTHFDNNAPNQERSAPIVVERMLPRAAELPLILTGDFNATPSSAAYQTLAASFTDAYDVAAERQQVSAEDPAPPWDPEERIDHIFFASPEAMAVERHRVDLSRYGDPLRFPSDHWPISATISW